jgi:circadian clock protein KaiB
MVAQNPSKLKFRLYVTNQAPSSLRAIANLKTICADYFENAYELEIVDTAHNPRRAIEDGIIVTPTLLKMSPEPSWSIVGDLSEDARVLASMSAPRRNSAH